MNQSRVVFQRSSPSSITGAAMNSRERRVEAIQQFFLMMEKKFGGNIKSLMDTGLQAEVIESKSFIRTEDLKRLMNHDATAIHVKQFYDPQISKDLGKSIAEKALLHANNWRIGSNNNNNSSSSNDVSRGMESSDVSTMGEYLPFNVVACNGSNNKNSMDAYFDGVQREFQKRKQNYDKPIWPLDQLRLELDEAWPAGAGLARDKQTKRPFGAGLPRIMMGPTRWKKDGYIHVDEMAPLTSNQGLFSANIYLQLPDKNNTNDQISTNKNIHTNTNAGDFAIWPLGIRSRWDWYKVSAS